jgi:hypothetical protein
LKYTEAKFLNNQIDNTTANSAKNTPSKSILNRAASSASNAKCSTLVDKPALSRVLRKRRLESRFNPPKNVLHFNIVAVEVGSYA